MSFGAGHRRHPERPDDNWISPEIIEIKNTLTAIVCNDVNPLLADC